MGITITELLQQKPSKITDDDIEKTKNFLYNCSELVNMTSELIHACSKTEDFTDYEYIEGIKETKELLDKRIDDIEEIMFLEDLDVYSGTYDAILGEGYYELTKNLLKKMNELSEFLDEWIKNVCFPSKYKVNNILT